jgi:hypothetical protein
MAAVESESPDCCSAVRLLFVIVSSRWRCSWDAVSGAAPLVALKSPSCSCQAVNGVTTVAGSAAAVTGYCRGVQQCCSPLSLT